MTKDELIDKILAELYKNSNQGMEFYDEFSAFENDINKLESVKSIMENEGLIINHKNQKSGISPLGFKICFEGGYLKDRNKKERILHNTLRKNKLEISYLRKELRTKNKVVTFLIIVTICCISVLVLAFLGMINF